MMTPQQIVQDLAHMLCDFQGQQYLGEIGPETRFFEDLSFTSIDAVVLAESLELRYGQRFPFRELREHIAHADSLDFSIGQLADFLHQHMTHIPDEN